MRIATVIFAGSVAGALALATPALANSLKDQRPADEAVSSSPCQAYQMGSDGTWHQQPCQEAGAAAQAQRKSSADSGASKTRTR